MKTRQWCITALLVVTALGSCSAAPQEATAALSKTTTASSQLGGSVTGKVKASDEDEGSDNAVKLGSNGFGTVGYESASSDSDSDSSETDRLAFEAAEEQQPNLRVRLRLGIGV